MIKECDIDYLEQCVEIAFEQNDQPENNCAFCPNSRKSICEDFEYIISNPDCLMVGCFTDDILTGILGCFLNPANNWVDCVGPFFKDGWHQDFAKDMFSFAKSALTDAVRFNFYFNSENRNCHYLMEILSAERQDNEYILLLNRREYRPQQVKPTVVKYTDKYEKDLVRLHDETFPDVYVTGKDIIASNNKTREVFCALDENGEFVGYGVLKYADGNAHLTAEIFAVRKEKRGKGFGWALLNTVVASAFNNHNGNVVDLVVDMLNTHARDLYYSYGFKLAVENEAFNLRK